MVINSAKSLGLGQCPHCHKLNRDTGDKIICSRCHSSFYPRKYKSIEFTLAWLIASAIMFIPANLVPMMVFTAVGNEDASTIMGGIIAFIEMGMLPVAIIIFIASFLIPLSKIAGIAILLYGVHQGPRLEPEQRTKLYRLVEFLGPWSMLDVFVVSIMAAVVNLGFVTTIVPAPGITYFALMVVFTMFSAGSFDPRLLWDSQNNEK